MAKTFSIVFLLALAGCSAVPSAPLSASPCSISQASYECQVERYNAVSVP